MSPRHRRACPGDLASQGRRGQIRDKPGNDGEEGDTYVPRSFASQSGWMPRPMKPATPKTMPTAPEAQPI